MRAEVKVMLALIAAAGIAWAEGEGLLQSLQPAPAPPRRQRPALLAGILPSISFRCASGDQRL